MEWELWGMCFNPILSQWNSFTIVDKREKLSDLKSCVYWVVEIVTGDSWVVRALELWLLGLLLFVPKLLIDEFHLKGK